MRPLTALAIASFAAMPAWADDRALVIGIDDYAAVSGAQSLTGAVRDADRIAALLTETLGYDADQVTVLRNTEARHDVILSAIIDRLIAETRPGDRVFLYFAGIGTVLDDGTRAIVAADGETVVGRIPMETLASILAHISDRDVTVVFDAGFHAGGPGTRGLGAVQANAPFDLGDGIGVWTAAEPGQPVWEDASGGVFTTFWSQSLTREAADLNGDFGITAREVFDDVAPRVASWCSQSDACAALVPGYAGPDSAVLSRLAAPEPEAPPVLEPIEQDDGLPANYRETLGFVTDLFSPSNEAGLALNIQGGETLRIGEIVSFTATADRTGALLLLDLDPSGALAQVYPSRLSVEGDTRLEAGQVLTIPSALSANGQPLRIRVSEPAGQGLLLGLFIEGDLGELAAIMPAGLEGGPIANGNQSLFQISQNLLRLEADPARNIRWSAAYFPYLIEP